MASVRQVRKMFRVQKMGTAWYRVFCNVDGCPWSSLGWDYRYNALTQGYGHIEFEHKIVSEPRRYGIDAWPEVNYICH